MSAAAWQLTPEVAILALEQDLAPAPESILFCLFKTCPAASGPTYVLIYISTFYGTYCKSTKLTASAIFLSKL